jgi:hypothetical protein
MCVGEYCLERLLTNEKENRSAHTHKLTFKTYAVALFCLKRLLIDLKQAAILNAVKSFYTPCIESEIK